METLNTGHVSFVVFRSHEYDAKMQKATFELPSSLFEVKWGSQHRPDNHNIDRFRLFEGMWHWHRSCKDDLNEIYMGTSESLRGISQLFSTQNEDGEALYAEFFCAPRIESVLEEGKEDSLAIFPLDAILEEIENIFSRIKYSFLEYGAGRQWMIVRFSDWAPSHFTDGTQKKASHLFWFDAEGIESLPQLVYINHEMPDDSITGDNWKTWEVLLRSEAQLILCTSPRGEPSYCQRLDMSFESSPEFMSPSQFLFLHTSSLTVAPDLSLRDAWGYLILGGQKARESLGLGFVQDND
jgi:hypothetical protein